MKCVWITPFYERSAMNNRHESQALPTRPLHVYSNAVGPGITTAVNHVATVMVLLCRITSALCRLFNRGYCQRIPTLQQSALPHVVRRFFPQRHRIVGIAAVVNRGRRTYHKERLLSKLIDFTVCGFGRIRESVFLTKDFIYSDLQNTKVPYTTFKTEQGTF